MGKFSLPRSCVPPRDNSSLPPQPRFRAVFHRVKCEPHPRDPGFHRTHRVVRFVRLGCGAGGGHPGLFPFVAGGARTAGCPISSIAQRGSPCGVVTLCAHAPIAQLVELRTFNPQVVGSSPTGGTGQRRRRTRRRRSSFPDLSGSSSEPGPYVRVGGSRAGRRRCAGRVPSPRHGALRAVPARSGAARDPCGPASDPVRACDNG